MTRVLVTGATGFIGRAVVARLRADGRTIRAAVRRPERLPAGIEAAPIPALEDAAFDWAPLLDGVDQVVHLAARVHVMTRTAGDSEAAALARYRAVNVEPTRRLAEAAARAGVRRLLLMSSVKALGDGGDAVLTEATLPAPADPYGVSKREAETALHDAARASGIDWVALRPPLVYGPGVGANFLRLLRLARLGLPLPLGAVRARRSLVFVDNLADAVARCLDHPAAAGHAFLIHDGPPLTVPELFTHLARLSNRPARLWPVPPALLHLAATVTGTRAFYQRLCGSLEVDDGPLRRLTGWTPPVATEDGLRRTVRWFMETRP